MPAPYITASELIQQAHANGTHPYEQTLDIADDYGWDDDHTIEALHAVRRTMDNLPQPQPHHAVQLADQFSQELDRDTLTLADTIASFLTTLTAYEQSGDPSEADALATLEADLARMVGLATDEDPDDDRDHP